MFNVINNPIIPDTFGRGQTLTRSATTLTCATTIPTQKPFRPKGNTNQTILWLLSLEKMSPSG
jgi:hypothetical protein